MLNLVKNVIVFLGPKDVSITQERLAILSFKFTHNNSISAFTYNLYYANHSLLFFESSHSLQEAFKTIKGFPSKET